jgi:hypothetical protein
MPHWKCKLIINYSCLQGYQLLFEENNIILCKEIIEKIEEIKCINEIDIASCRLYQFEIYIKLEDHIKSIELIENIITNNLKNFLPKEILNQFYSSLWNLGITKFQEKQYSNCLMWLQCILFLK